MGMQKLKKAVNSQMALMLQLLLVGLWGAQLLNSDAYYVNYALLLIITGICCYKNIKSGDLLCSKNWGKYIDTVLNIFAVLFSIMVASANYKIWAFAEIPEDYGFRFKWFFNTLMTIIFFAGGYIAFWNIFHVVFSHIKSLVWEKSSKLIDSKKIFWISFVLLVLSRWIVLYFCQYPGELTPDSISQMSQLMSGTYSNHHPFYHTMVIKCFVDLGLNIFNDINAAVATYSFFQILFTAMCFSFAVSTMAKMEAPRWMIITTMSFFIMMPYHILYAITMWKDIMFGCFILLFVTFVYRCIKDIGNNIFNYIMLAISSMGTCLFRSNGFFAFVILTFTFIMLWKLKNRRMLVIFASAIVLSFIMKHGVLAKLGVTQPDTIESLSIPAQQIARVVYEGCELDDWERATLGEIIDIGQIAENYEASCTCVGRK